jgi:signal transduction histidine kinase
MEEAERLKEEEARRRTDEERMRIAREIHDIASHTISIIVIQSSVAREALRDCAECPDSVRTALDVIRVASKEAMSEMQAAIGVLRAGACEFEPMPGLAQVERLMSSAAEAGLEVLRTVQGTARPLSPVMDLTAYRIIQESLTNTLRHAAAKTAEVDLAYDERGLAVRVSDDGRGPTGGTGYGLVSMRERASTVGGWADAGPRAGGGFEVRAWLPAPREDSDWRGSS